LFIGPQSNGEAADSKVYRLAGTTSRATSIFETYGGDGGIYERLDGGAKTWIAQAIASVRK